MPDNVNHPPHYNNHPSGVECITITQHMNFCLGNAMKYIWRADMKGGTEDIEKAIWYLQREIKRRVNSTFTKENTAFIPCTQVLTMIKNSHITGRCKKQPNEQQLQPAALDVPQWVGL